MYTARNVSCCRFGGHKDNIVTHEPEIGYHEAEVRPRIQDLGSKVVTERGGAVAWVARDLDITESVLRRWIREMSMTPAVALPGNGQMRAVQPLSSLLPLRFWGLRSSSGSAWPWKSQPAPTHFPSRTGRGNEKNCPANNPSPGRLGSRCQIAWPVTAAQP